MAADLMSKLPDILMIFR